MYVLHNLQGQFSGTDLLRFTFKLFNEVESLQLLAKVSHIFGPIKEAASVPPYTNGMLHGLIKKSCRKL